MLFPELSPGHRESILRHNWWGHDGRWYMFVANELGFHKANEMNMAINKAVGKLEINNLMALSGISQELRQLDLIEILRMNLELCAKDVFGLKELVEEGWDFIMRIDSCPAHSGTQKAGYTSDYECACFKRAEGWFEALGVNGTSFVRKSLVRGDEFCEVVIRSANVDGFSAEVVQ